MFRVGGRGVVIAVPYGWKESWNKDCGIRIAGRGEWRVGGVIIADARHEKQPQTGDVGTVLDPGSR